ncbi:MAG: CotH kinase family protein, partial [Planctomycetales bacterium]|nr:CotH kinase family protein [Planctomycetales bacterium]
SAEGELSRSPFVPNVDLPRGYDEYYGTVFTDPQIQTPLDVLHWFVPDPNWHKTGNGNNTRWSPASVYYAGRFYDNLMVRVRGQSTVNWDKPKFKFEFNPGRPFWYSDTLPAVDEFNLQSHFVEKGATSYMGENLAFGFLEAAGVPAPHTQHFHVRQNGHFYSLASLIEQIDETFLERHGYDATNPMYKANSSSAQSTLAVGPNRTNYQKVTRQDEPFDDLIEFTNGINGQIPNVDRSSYLFDAVDLPQVINNMAANTILTNHDRLTKNYYVYRDQSSTQFWNMFPWDMDQAFALRTDENFASILYGDSEHPQATGQPIYQNHLLDAILDTPATRAMYLRRLRTLYDDFLAAGYFEQHIEAYRLQIEQDAAADHAIWNAGTLDAGIDRLHYNLDFRRRQLAADPLLPASQYTHTDTIVLDQDAESVWWVPTDNSLDDRWFASDFVADHWLPAEGGVGYERGTGYEPFLGTMYGSLDRTLPIRLDDWMDRNGDGDPDGTSVYVRYEFDLSEFQAIDRLLLRARFDDGIVVYLNGQEVAKSGVVGEGWDAVALRNNEADQSFTQFDLTPLLTTGQLTLQPGRNVLAIQVVNRQANSPDLLVQPQLLVGQRSQQTFDIAFGEFSDATDASAQQYLRIDNHESSAVDLSGWTIRGAAEFRFAAGTVVPAGSSVFVVTDANGFRNREFAPQSNLQTFFVPGLHGSVQPHGQFELFDGQGQMITNATWRTEITGDLNHDGQISVLDIDRLCAAIRSGEDNQAFDFQADNRIDQNDLHVFIRDILKTRPGDVNLDGQFDSTDLVLVFQAGEYDDALVRNSSYATGDWNCDQEFDSADFVTVFQF